MVILHSELPNLNKKSSLYMCAKLKNFVFILDEFLKIVR